MLEKFPPLLLPQSILVADEAERCISTSPVTVPPASGSFAAMLLVTLVLNEASSPIAAANSFKVSNAPGAASITLFIAAVI